MEKRVRRRQSQTSKPETGLDEDKNLKQLHVLIADDDLSSQELATILMERSGYRVTVVADGCEAVRAVERHPFDIILMNIRMPVLNGIEATRKIRELGGLAAQLPIIAVTTYANHEDHEAYVLAGMNDLVGKPYKNKHLIQIVEFWLAKNLCKT